MSFSQLGSSVDVSGSARGCSLWFVFASVLCYQLLRGRLVKKTDTNCTLQKPTQVPNNQYLLRIPIEHSNTICNWIQPSKLESAEKRKTNSLWSQVLFHYIIGSLIVDCTKQLCYEKMSFNQAQHQTKRRGKTSQYCPANLRFSFGQILFPFGSCYS